MTDRKPSPSSGSEQKPPYMREERFDNESPDRLLDSRPTSSPMQERKPDPKKRKLLQS